jgi:PPOX class probable F420-dependent enzyme
MDKTETNSQEQEPQADRPYMPGYGIADATSGKGLFPWSWAKERLSRSRNYWLSTTRPDGTPHAMPVWGIWMDGAFYFSTGRRSRKARNLTANPRCVVCPDNADQAVVLEGTVEEVTDPVRLKKFADEYKIKYAWDMESMDTSDSYFYVVRPRVAFGLTEGLSEVATRFKFD